MTKPKIPVYEQALKYLNIKMYSEADLTLRLSRKGYDTAEIDGVIADLKRSGAIDDRKYAEIYIQNLIDYRTFGYYGVRNKLIQKRLPKNLVDSLLKRFLNDEVESGIAQKFLERAVNKSRSKESLIRAMKQKGYRTSVILEVLKTHRKR